jgi:hypothetical protein
LHGFAVGFSGLLLVKRTAEYRVLVRKPEGMDHLKDPGVDGRIVLKWIFKQWVGVWTGSNLLRIGPGDGLF